MVRPGMLISDRYEIIEKVGSGGMADVYKAKCHRLNRYVAIKILKAEYSEDTGFVEKFRREAQSAAGLSHPNIVNVYDVGDDDGLYYIVMELVEGITLKSFIERKGKLEVKEVLGISIQIAQGMEAAHSNHIIHRDIKPQNIIISREGKVKVTDFGIAKAASSNTITSNAMGSVHYISPEQARGGYSDEKSDIYSLGITMYEMLTGRVPFIADSTVSVALLHIQGEAIPMRELEPTIPISLDKIVQKCMQKKPERRYASVTELIQDLRKAITNPNDDFVKIPPMLINDSPTIHISDDEINHIKSASKEMPAQPVFHEEEEKDVPPNEEELEDDDLDDDEDEDDVDPKIQRLMAAGGIAAGLVLVGLIIFIVFTVFGKGSGGKTPVLPSVEPTASDIVETVEPSAIPEETKVVPNVVGETKEKAEEILKGQNIGYRFTEEHSATVKEGVVISQTPEKDTKAASDTVVHFVVSLGAEKIYLPDVYKKEKRAAIAELEDAGFVVEKEYAYDDNVKEGYVIKTNPERGAVVSAGETVKVTISYGKETNYVYVPDLSNLSENEAKEKLKSAGLKVGAVKTSYSDNVKKGNVMSQEYSVNSQVEEGTSIGFTVSLGQKEVQKNYKYIGSALITYNPFEYEDESGTITITLTQSGKSKQIYNADCDMSDFPLPLNDIKGFDDSDGTLTMQLDGVDVGEPITISFTKVEA